MSLDLNKESTSLQGVEDVNEDETGMIQMECRLLDRDSEVQSYRSVYLFHDHVYLECPQHLMHPLARAVANVTMGR
jgi:hypothetical protein